MFGASLAPVEVLNVAVKVPFTVLSYRGEHHYVIIQLNMSHTDPCYRQIWKYTAIVFHMLRVDTRGHWRVDVYSEIGQKLWESNRFSSWFKPVLLHVPRSNISFSCMSSLDPSNHQKCCCLHLDGVMPQGVFSSPSIIRAITYSINISIYWTNLLVSAGNIHVGHRGF